jgi:hypothetical protein
MHGNDGVGSDPLVIPAQAGIQQAGQKELAVPKWCLDESQPLPE